MYSQATPERYAQANVIVRKTKRNAALKMESNMYLIKVVFSVLLLLHLLITDLYCKNTFTALQGTIRSPNGFVLYHNGAIVKETSSGSEQNISLNLITGINTIAVSCAPQVECSLSAGQVKVTDKDMWRINEREETNWPANDYNDKSWKIGKPAEYTPAGKIFLRKVVLVRDTPDLYAGYAFPNEREKYFDVPYTICKNSVQLLILRLYNPLAGEIGNIKYRIDLPKGFTILDVNKRTYLIGEGVANNPKMSEEKIMRDNLGFNRYTLIFDKPLAPTVERTGRVHSSYYDIAMFLVKADKEAPSSATFYSRQSAEDGTILSAEKTLSVEILPELAASPRKDRHIMIDVDRRLARFSDEEQEALLNTFNKAGVDELHFHVSRTLARAEYNARMKNIVKTMHKYGIRAIISQDEDWGSDYLPYDKKPEHSAYDKDGNIYKQSYPGWERNKAADIPCPTWLIEENDGAGLTKRIVKIIKGLMKKDGEIDVKKQIVEVMKEYNADGYCRSVEMGASDRYCFCNRCINEFKKMYPDASPAEIAPGSGKWLDFRCRQNAEISGIMNGAVHAVGKDKVFYCYSSFQGETGLQRYKTDWKYYQDRCDIAIAGIIGSLEDTQKALGKTRWIGRVGTYAYQPREANNIIYAQFVKSNCFGIRIFEYFQTQGITYYLTSLLAQYGTKANEYMPREYSIGKVVLH